MSLIIEVLATAAVVTVGHNAATILNYVKHYSRSGIDLTGDWELHQAPTTEDGGEITKKWKTDISIRQIGTKISGKAIAKPVNNTSSPVKYKITGVYENGYAALTFRDLERMRFSISTFLLKSSSSGAILDGHRLFSGKVIDSSRAVECTWRRLGVESEDDGCGKILA